MATLQVKGMDDDLYKALGARATIDNRSVSQEVVMIIREFLARPTLKSVAATRAFMELAGSWADERSAHEIAKSVRKARRSSTRFGRTRNVFA